MRKPFWRKTNGHWWLEINRKQHRLSEEPYQYDEPPKNPPPEIEKAWHALIQKGTPKDMKLGELAARYIETLERPEYTKSATFFLKSFEQSAGGSTRIAKLIPLHLTNWLAANPNWGDSSKRTAVCRVHSAINWAVRQGIIDKNPILSTPGYKREGRFRKRKGTVPIAVAEALEQKARPAFSRFLKGLRLTGARPSELRRARIEKCDLATGMLAVPNKTEKATGESERTIILSTEAKELIREAIGNRTEGFIFLTTRGQQWSGENLGEYWQRTKKGCKWRDGVPVPKGVSIYSYRHQFISRAINDTNVNPAIVAQLAGHKDLKMLIDFYLEKDPEALKRAVEQINAPEPPREPKT